MALEVLEANFGAVNHKVVPGGGDARRQRTETEPQPEELVVKRSQRQRQSQIAEKEHRGEDLGRRRVEDLRESISLS